MRNIVFCVIGLVLFCCGCVDPARVDKIDARLSALEEQSKKAKADSEQRRQQLEQCVKDEADEAYWNIIRHNTTYNSKTGTWSGPSYAFDRAERAKKDKIEECKLLYGK